MHYIISSEAQKDILKRLLELNHKIHAEEVAKGLGEKKSSKSKTKVTVNKEQGGLFGDG